MGRERACVGRNGRGCEGGTGHVGCRSWPSYEEGSEEAEVPSAKGNLTLVKN